MRNVKERIGWHGAITYMFRVSVGYTAEGKQIRKTMSYRPSGSMTPKQIEREIEIMAIEFEQKAKQGYSVDGSIKFSEYAKYFMEVKEMSPKCRETYADFLIKINVAIGHVRLEKLQPIHLQEYYKDLRKVISKKTKLPYSDKTILHHHRLIGAILAQATKEQIISRNIASRSYMDAPKVAKKEPEYLDDIQAQNVVALLLDERDIRVKTSILLLIYTGMRRGELCGLEWKDIDFKNNLIQIHRATQYIAGQGIITKDPKNETSKRTLKQPIEVMNILKEYKVWQAQERLKSGDTWKDRISFKVLSGSGYATKETSNERIFTTSEGNLISPDTINFWLERFLEKNNLPIVSPHSLRHTNITLQIAAGVSLRTIAARAGHSLTSTTTNIYSHAIKSADEIASEALGDILTPKSYKTK